MQILTGSRAPLVRLLNSTSLIFATRQASRLRNNHYQGDHIDCRPGQLCRHRQRRPLRHDPHGGSARCIRGEFFGTLLLTQYVTKKMIRQKSGSMLTSPRQRGYWRMLEPSPMAGQRRHLDMQAECLPQNLARLASGLMQWPLSGSIGNGGPDGRRSAGKID